MKRCMQLSFMSILLLSCLSIWARDIKVVIASQNAHKIQAVSNAFKDKFLDDNIQFIVYKTASLIPEQPIGKDVALKGAQNRLNGIEHDAILSDYCIAIESYIEQSPSTASWYDVGLILLRDASQPGKDMILLTKPTHIPHQFIQLAAQMSDATKITAAGYPVTIGQAIASSFTDRTIDSHDWHSQPEFGGVSRHELLQEALFKALHVQEINELKHQIVTYPDFPKPGILFSDFLPILSNAKTFGICIDLLASYYKTKNISAVVGLESRGFILGAALAHKLGIGFVPVRKPGKLPGPVFSVSYQKEYGSDTLVISQSALQKSQRVLIIDDLIATGGSARAAIDLVKLAGGVPVEFVSLLQIKELAEMAKLSIPSFNLID